MKRSGSTYAWIANAAWNFGDKTSERILKFIAPTLREITISHYPTIVTVCGNGQTTLSQTTTP